MQKSSDDVIKSAMISVIGIDQDIIKNICHDVSNQINQEISISNYLSHLNYVVSGSLDACNLFISTIKKSHKPRLVRKLNVSGGFHSNYMKSSLELYSETLNTINIKSLESSKIRVLSNYTTLPYGNVQSIKDNLLNQLIYPVQWETIMNIILHDINFYKAYEIGTGTICRDIIKRIDSKYDVISLSK